MPSPLLYFFVTTKLEPKQRMDTSASGKPMMSVGILAGRRIAEAKVVTPARERAAGARLILNAAADLC